MTPCRSVVVVVVAAAAAAQRRRSSRGTLSRSVRSRRVSGATDRPAAGLSLLLLTCQWFSTLFVKSLPFEYAHS